MRCGQLVGERLRVQVADMHQAGGPGQARGDQRYHARHGGRGYHTMTLSGNGPRVTTTLARRAHGWRMNHRPARMEVVNAAVLPGAQRVA